MTHEKIGQSEIIESKFVKTRRVLRYFRSNIPLVIAVTGASIFAHTMIDRTLIHPKETNLVAKTSEGYAGLGLVFAGIVSMSRRLDTQTKQQK